MKCVYLFQPLCSITMTKSEECFVKSQEGIEEVMLEEKPITADQCRP